VARLEKFINSKQLNTFMADLPPPEDDVSQFNMHISMLIRINKLFYMVADCAINRDFDKWYQALKAIFREVSFKLKPEEMQIVNNHIKIINPLMIKYFESNGTKKVSVGRLANELENFEITLRKLLDKHGFLLAKGDAASAVLR